MLYIAYGSILELETQKMLSDDLVFIEKRALDSLLNAIAEIERMLMALIKSLENKPLNLWPPFSNECGEEPSLFSFPFTIQRARSRQTFVCLWRVGRSMFIFLIVRVCLCVSVAILLYQTTLQAADGHPAEQKGEGDHVQKIKYQGRG